MAGLPHDTTVVVEHRVTLGRAPDSDIQLNDPEVSRRHAKLEVDAAGVVTLVDLASTAGTYVDAVRVDRHPLRPGEVIAIGRFRLRYEEVSDEVAEQRPPRKHGMEVLRPTTRFEPGAGPAAPARRRPPPTPRSTVAMTAIAAPAPTLPPDTSRIVVPVVPRLAARAIPRAPRGALDLEAPVPAPEHAGVPQPVDDREPSSRLADPEPAGDRDPLVVRAETMAVVRSVFDYRYLRLAQLAHEILDHDELTRLEELQQQLEHALGDRDDVSSQRRYRRFGCAVPASLVHHDGRRLSTTAVALEDLSAGGAQACITDVLVTGQACWLVVDLEDERPNPVVVFGARVVWSLPDDHRVGLVFSGGVRAGVDAMALVRAEAGLD